MSASSKVIICVYCVLRLDGMQIASPAERVFNTTILGRKRMKMNIKMSSVVVPLPVFLLCYLHLSTPLSANKTVISFSFITL